MLRKQSRRILTFLPIPTLLVILLLVNDIWLRLIGALIIIVYVAMVIFLRDSKFEEDTTSSYKSDDKLDNDTLPSTPDTQEELEYADEGFSIKPGRSASSIIDSDEIKIFKRASRPSIEMPSDLKERYTEISNEMFPEDAGEGSKFSFVLEKILTIIKESFSANTAIFFWYQKKKNKLTIEKYVSNSRDIQQRKFDIEADVLGNIVEKGEPELRSDIPVAAEADIIRYYKSPQGIRSILGVPVFYHDQLIGVLAIDSKESDVFGLETVFTLGRFVRLITLMISLFEERYEESVSQNRLHGLLELITPLSSVKSAHDTISLIEKSIESLIHWDAFVLVSYDPEKKHFRTSKVINKKSLKFVGENLIVELKGTMAGKCILSGKPVKIDDTATINLKRFSSHEDVVFDGSFIAIPLIYQNQNYGLLWFESLKKDAYGTSDITFLQSITNILSFVMYAYSSQILMKSLIAYDLDTKIFNRSVFEELVTKELIKTRHLDITSSFALIKIDEFLEQVDLFEDNPLQKIAVAICELIKNEIDASCIFGRISDKVFGVYFFNKNTQDVFIWAEKIRVKIARLNVPALNIQNTFTVSIGISSCNEKETFNELYENAELALQKAVKNGGNKTTNIN